MKSLLRTWAALSLVAIASLVVSCDRGQHSAEVTGGSSPEKPTLELGKRRIEALIVCYKAILLVQQKYGGIGSNSKFDGIRSTLEPSRRIIEQRLIGDLTNGAEKMRINERIQSDIDTLMIEKPYTSTNVLLNTAHRCAKLERQNGWGVLGD